MGRSWPESYYRRTRPQIRSDIAPPMTASTALRSRCLRPDMHASRAHGEGDSHDCRCADLHHVARAARRWLALYEAEGMPIHVRHLGQPIGVFTTDVRDSQPELYFFWGFRSQADQRATTRRLLRGRSRLGLPIERKAQKPAASSIRSPRSSSPPSSRQCEDRMSFVGRRHTRGAG